MGRSSLPSSARFLRRTMSYSGGRTKRRVTENTLSKSRQTEPSGSGCQGTLPVKSTSKRIRDPQGSANQARRRGKIGLAEVSKPSSDTNAPRRPSISIETGWRKTTTTKQTIQTGWWNTPQLKIHAVQWTPPTIHDGLAEGHTRPPQPPGRGCQHK